MKRYIKNLFLFAMLSGLGLTVAGLANAQTFTTLHHFSNNSGADPFAGLILSSNTLYGTAYAGGTFSRGVLFKVDVDGTGYTNFYTFTGGGDGAYPYSSLILSGNILYGTAENGGSAGNGTLFKVNINGTGFSTLHTFTAMSGANINGDGAYPESALTLSGNTLYGTSYRGGSFGHGTIFAINTNGFAFTNLHSFAGLPTDGARPYAGLILSGSTLYGTTQFGGSSGEGTIFAINTDGSGFTNLYHFTATVGDDINSDGANPVAGLILSGNRLYGTAYYGGSSGKGTVFAVDTNGGNFTTLHSFIATNNYPYVGSFGAIPSAGLVLSGNTLYGTTTHGGSSGKGTVFAVNTDGTGFTNFSFMATSGPSSTNSSGAEPYGGLIFSGNALYGTTYNGGGSGKGTVFSLSFSLQLTLNLSEANAVLTWPTNVAGFDYGNYGLQSTTNLMPPIAWDTNLPAPVVVNGQSTVTNPISGTQKFYRLKF